MYFCCLFLLLPTVTYLGLPAQQLGTAADGYEMLTRDSVHFGKLPPSSIVPQMRASRVKSYNWRSGQGFLDFSTAVS